MEENDEKKKKKRLDKEIQINVLTGCITQSAICLNFLIVDQEYDKVCTLINFEIYLQ